MDTPCVSERNLTRSPLFFSAGRPLLPGHGPSHPRPLFLCVLQQFCFPVLFPAIFTPLSKIGRTLIWVCCCYSVAISELPITACPNSRKYALRQHELWLTANQLLRLRYCAELLLRSSVRKPFRGPKPCFITFSGFTCQTHPTHLHLPLHKFPLGVSGRCRWGQQKNVSFINMDCSLSAR